VNLKEALDYRNKCFICQTDMEIKSPDLAGVNMYVKENGLFVSAQHNEYSVHFKYDGTYKKMKKWNSLYAKPLLVLKECPICYPFIKSNGKKVKVKYKSRTLGITTLSQLKDFSCTYSFELFGDDRGNFDTIMDSETIRFHDDINFYHLDTSFKDNVTTTFLSGPLNATEIKELFQLTIPGVNLSKINDKESLINKLKLYNVFS
jgi:hypothetical protein